MIDKKNVHSVNVPKPNDDFIQINHCRYPVSIIALQKNHTFTKL